jgi:hypothetical protein
MLVGELRRTNEGEKGKRPVPQKCNQRGEKVYVVDGDAKGNEVHKKVGGILNATDLVDDIKNMMWEERQFQALLQLSLFMVAGSFTFFALAMTMGVEKGSTYALPWLIDFAVFAGLGISILMILRSRRRKTGKKKVLSPNGDNHSV